MVAVDLGNLELSLERRQCTTRQDEVLDRIDIVVLAESGALQQAAKTGRSGVLHASDQKLRLGDVDIVGEESKVDGSECGGKDDRPQE